jgi:hypothetical protein
MRDTLSMAKIRSMVKTVRSREDMFQAEIKEIHVCRYIDK